VTNLAVIDRETGELAPAQDAWWTDRSKVDLVKTTIAKGATDDEFALFLAICQRTGLDPFARQVFAVKRWDRSAGREVMQTQVSVDGLRLIAVRSGLYGGQTVEEWCGPDGVWVGAWLRDEPPAAARVGVYRLGTPNPTYAVATYREYVQTNKQGHPTAMWARMPARMLLKCAESLALRKTFPAELAGLYTVEEMGQAETPAAPARSVDDVARDVGCSVDDLFRWWTRDGREWAPDVLAKMRPEQVARAASSIAEWRADELAAEARETLDATDVEDAEIVDPVDAAIAAESAPAPSASLLDDDLPF